jgi:hypothetical protein
MLQGQDMAFGMRHQTEDAAGGIAEASDIALGAIGILAGCVAKDNLPGLIKTTEDPVSPAAEVAFAVGDGQFELLEALEKGAAMGADGEGGPAILEAAGGIGGQSGEWSLFIGGDEESGLECGLEAVADSEDEFLGVAESSDRLGEKAGELDGEDFAGGNVITMREAAGEGEDLIAAEQAGIVAQAIDVHAIDGGTGELEGKREFPIAVSPGRTEDQNMRGRHERKFREERS